MKKVYQSIDKLICYAKANLYLDKRNEDYIRNSIFQLFNLESYHEKYVEQITDLSPESLLKEFTDACIACSLFEHHEAEYYCDQVMGLLSLLPNEIENLYNSYLKNQGSEAATQWFYNYCVKNDYVKLEKLKQNIRFDSNGLVITINKAKPEFRDSKKAKLGNSTKGGYPKCSICHENEGFAGRNKKTLRTVDLKLCNQDWFWQFSPYGYFNQHGIAVNYEHTPMHVDKDTFHRLIEFIDIYPHFFIGCNAALPGIGGSVLAHDHYQGGKEILPMHKAKAKYTMLSDVYTDASVEILDWPNTVIRIVSGNRKSIAEISEMIREKWVNYEDLSLGIVCSDKDGLHNAVSPTIVKTRRGYEMNIILRNNITSEEYPDGVFHAHPEFHIIKKESIGLIEAQGLFILPGRLDDELKNLEDIISQGKELPLELQDFKLVYNEIVDLCKNDYSPSNVHKAMEAELGSICYKILENTAVFKDQKLTIKFMEDLGFTC